MYSYASAGGLIKFIKYLIFGLIIGKFFFTSHFKHFSDIICYSNVTDGEYKIDSKFCMITVHKANNKPALFSKDMLCFFSTVRNNCGRMLNATTTQAWLSSPDSDGDGLYDNSVNCSWSIEASEGMVVELQIDVKNIECGFDHLEVNYY